ncbi:MAG: V-type ATP synthase subunit E family protein [Eubacteriales bacterium]|nr:V-type ATP synthase subunit E family protein [Eubacteriales bacterium]
MSKLDNIKDAILAEAQAEAQAILDQAQGESQDYLNGVRQEEAAAIERQKLYANNKAASLSEQIAAAANLRARDMVLKAQQDLIDRVLERAKEKLLAFSDTDLAQLIQEKLDACSFQEGEVLVLPAGRELELNCSLPRAYDDSLKVGFALRREGVTRKFDFLEILDNGRDDWEQLILRELAVGR